MFPFKGLLFDMNGTLLRDNELHEKAWIEIAKDFREKPLTVEEFQEKGPLYIPEVKYQANQRLFLIM